MNNTTDYTTDNGFILDKPEQISAYRLLTMYYSLRAEVQGFRMTRINVFALVKKEFGLKGTKIKVLAEFKALLQEAGVLSPTAKEDYIH